MGENMFFYDHRTEKLLRDRPSTSSSDSEEFGLIIDLDLEMNHCKTTASNNSNKECNNDESDDDTLSIGCEENETSVNFFIKVEKPKEPPKLFKQKWTGTKKSNPNQIKCVVTPTEKPKQNQISMYQCNKCKYETATINGLFIHFTKSHPKDNFKCTECPYETTKLDKYVYEHMKSHYIDCVTYKCKCCTYVTSGKDRFKEHKLLHVKMKKEKEAKFQCPVCSFSKGFVSTLNHFKTHAKMHKDLKNIHICPVCNMKVKNLGKHAKHHVKLKFDDAELALEEEDKDKSNKKKCKDRDDTLKKKSTDDDVTLEKKSTDSDDTLKKKSTNGDGTLEKKSTDSDDTLVKKSTNGDDTLEKKSTDGDGALEIVLNYVDEDIEMTM